MSNESTRCKFRVRDTAPEALRHFVAVVSNYEIERATRGSKPAPFHQVVERESSGSCPTVYTLNLAERVVRLKPSRAWSFGGEGWPRPLTPDDVEEVAYRDYPYTVNEGLARLTDLAAQCLKLYPLLAAGPVPGSRELPTPADNEMVRSMIPMLQRIPPDQYETLGLVIAPEPGDCRRVNVSIADVIFTVWVRPNLTGMVPYFRKAEAL